MRKLLYLVVLGISIASIIACSGSPKSSYSETYSKSGNSDLSPPSPESPPSDPIDPETSGPKRPEVRPVQRSTLKAGSHNDNEEFVRYLEYLHRFSHLPVTKLDVAERYILQIKDRQGRAVPNCRLEISTTEGSPLTTLITTSSGEAVLFPNSFGKRVESSTLFVRGRYKGQQFHHTFVRGVEQVVTISTNLVRVIPQPLTLDIVFVLDTTGSMGDEIQRLRDTLFSINHQITARRHLKVKPRFGMVLYRDVGDLYVTKVESISDDIAHFQNALDRVKAGGGGDTPEEMEEGLEKALTELNWNKDGIRLMFLMTDAPPQLQRPRSHNYIWSAQQAARHGIKIYPVGASGLDEVGEYVLRQLGLFTQGHYIFLTYGEKGESSSSSEAKVSHHTGANYEVALLDTLIVRMIKQELSYLVDPSLIIEEELPTPEKFNAATLNERIHNIVEQLYHQAKNRLAQKPLLAVFPLRLQSQHRTRLNNVNFYVKDGVEEQLRAKKCRLLEREEVKTAIKERLVAAGTVLDDEELSKITKIKGADVFLSGKIYPLGQSVVLFMQLVDVQTLQKVAVARVLWTPE